MKQARGSPSGQALQLQLLRARVRRVAQHKHASCVVPHERLHGVPAHVRVHRDALRLRPLERRSRVRLRSCADVASLGVENHGDVAGDGANNPVQRVNASGAKGLEERGVGLERGGELCARSGRRFVASAEGSESAESRGGARKRHLVRLLNDPDAVRGGGGGGVLLQLRRFAENSECAVHAAESDGSKAEQRAVPGGSGGPDPRTAGCCSPPPAAREAPRTTSLFCCLCGLSSLDRR